MGCQLGIVGCQSQTCGCNLAASMLEDVSVSLDRHAVAATAHGHDLLAGRLRRLSWEVGRQGQDADEQVREGLDEDHAMACGLMEAISRVAPPRPADQSQIWLWQSVSLLLFLLLISLYIG